MPLADAAGWRRLHEDNDIAAAAELAVNATENLGDDRPWQNYKQQLPAGR
jgi:hypothetical protein